MLLKEILKSKGLKQKWLADKLGVSEVTVSSWCAGKSVQRKEHLKNLMSYLSTYQFDFPYQMNKSDNLLSFTVASLRLNEMVKVAQYFIEYDVLDLKQVKNADIIFSGMKSLTFEKTFYQIRKRLETLTPVQIEILANGDLISQKKIAFLSVCKCYSFIRDFTIEVIRDKVLMYDYQINETDFNSFIKNKLQEYPKLDGYSTSTFNKAKQVLFLILEQVGIIDNVRDKRIQLQILHPTVIKAIADDDPSWLKIFMIPDRDIKQLKF